MEKLSALLEQFELARYVVEEHRDGFLLHELDAFHSDLEEPLDLITLTFGAPLARFFPESDAEDAVSLVRLIELGQNYLL